MRHKCPKSFPAVDVCGCFQAFALQSLAWLQQNFAPSPRLADWRTSKPEGSMVGLDSGQHAETVDTADMQYFQCTMIWHCSAPTRMLR